MTVFIAPFLPYLVKAGTGAAEGLGKQVGGEVWERAKGIWNKLWPSAEAKPAALEAARDLAAAPDDEDALGAFRLQLRKLLADDPQLGDELGRLWQETKQSGVNVVASGERSVAIGGNVSESSIRTGDETGRTSD